MQKRDIDAYEHQFGHNNMEHHGDVEQSVHFGPAILFLLALLVIVIGWAVILNIYACVKGIRRSYAIGNGNRYHETSYKRWLLERFI